jgi:cytochrome c2
MKKLLITSLFFAALVACNSSTQESSEGNEASEKNETTANGNPSYDPNRGEGKFTKVDVSPTLDVTKADAGEKVFSVKCSSCHKLTEEKLVGPGWKGVTGRHTPEWILNFSTNTDAMINKDPKAQAMLEICLVRMPNQNLTDDDARNVYEYMRKNDGVK